MSLVRPFLRAGARLYRRLFQRRLDPQTREIVEVLRGVPAFGHLSSGALYAMAGVAHRRTYRRGESLYYEGDPGLGLYIVEAGRIRLKTEDDTGRSLELRELEANEMFGVLSLLGDFRRLETAKTITEARVLGFFRPDLKNVMRRNPKAAAEITMALARHVAAQHMELIRLMEEKGGRKGALEIYSQAASVVDVDAPPLR